MKLKAYIATMMNTRYQRKNSVQNSGVTRVGNSNDGIFEKVDHLSKENM